MRNWLHGKRLVLGLFGLLLLGLGGLAYLVASETPKGPLAKYLPDERRQRRLGRSS